MIFMPMLRTFQALVLPVAAAFVFVTGPAAAASCSAALNSPQTPFRIYGDTWYVGTHGVASILIASDRGLVLIDGDLAQSVPQIVANIKSTGHRLEDVKLILNSHVHCDHAGGIAELQRLTGAEVKASPSSASVLTRGGVGADDPQCGTLPPIDAVAHVGTIADGETLHVGTIAVTAHFTPGHTSGGTSWTWTECERGKCLNMVYADSLNPISAPGFRFTASTDYPSALRDFDHSFAVLGAVPCDILITVHPELNDLWTRLDRRNHGDANALIDSGACRRYADAERAALEKRVAKERAP